MSPSVGQTLGQTRKPENMRGLWVLPAHFADGQTEGSEVTQQRGEPEPAWILGVCPCRRTSALQPSGVHISAPRNLPPAPGRRRVGPHYRAGGWGLVGKELGFKQMLGMWAQAPGRGWTEKGVGWGWRLREERGVSWSFSPLRPGQCWGQALRSLPASFFLPAVPGFWFHFRI